MDGQTIAADPIDERRLQLARLRDAGIRLSTRLRQMSRDMVENTDLPDVDAIDGLIQFRNEFDRLQAGIPRASGTPGGPPEDVSLVEMQIQLDSQAIIQSALRRLDMFVRIQHIDLPEFPPWQRCLADARQLRGELVTVPSDRARITAEQFLSPQGPLNAALTLVSEGQELTDEQWSQLLDSVSAAYGREISTAIARGKLSLTTGVRA